MAALRGDSYDLLPRSDAFIAIWWVGGLAVCFGLLPRRTLSPVVRLALAALFALAAWTALGLLWTESQERTLAEALRVLGYVGVVALVGWAFGARERVLLVGVLAVVGATVCVLALVSRLAPELLTSATARAGYHRARLDYPFNYWNALGCWAAMTLALTAALSVHAGRRWVRGACLGAATLAPVVAYLTYSRTAIASAVLALALVVGFSSRRVLAAFNSLLIVAGAGVAILAVRAAPEIARGSGTSGRGLVAFALILVVLAALATAVRGPHERLAAVRVPRRSARRILAVALVAVAVAGVAVGPALARGAWRSFARNAPVTAVERPDPAARLTTLGGNRRLLWAVALKTFADHPLHGIGAGTFEFAWDHDPRRDGHVLDAHSLYLESLAELGLPGGLLVLLAIGALLVAAVRAPSRHRDGVGRGAAAGCAAAFVVFCVSAGVDWMWESTAVAFAGLTVGTVAAARHGPLLAAPRWSLRVAVVAAAAAAIVVQLPVLVAGMDVRASQAEAAHGRLADALSSADAAVAAEPRAASAHLQRALVLEDAGELATAARAAQDATRLEPANWTLWVVLGRIQAERGDIRSALAAVSRARFLSPRAPLFRPGVARQLARPTGQSGSG